MGSGLEALEAWRHLMPGHLEPLKPGGLGGLDALEAWRHGCQGGLDAWDDWSPGVLGGMEPWRLTD
jgi:hypothetical protein